MKIDRAIQQAAEAYSQRAQRAQGESAAVRGGEARANRSVELRISEASRELQRARALVDQAPDVRAERVRALKSSMAAGTYHVPAMEIAARLLEGGLNGIRGAD